MNGVISQTLIQGVYGGLYLSQKTIIVATVTNFQMRYYISRGYLHIIWTILFIGIIRWFPEFIGLSIWIVEKKYIKEMQFLQSVKEFIIIVIVYLFTSNMHLN